MSKYPKHVIIFLVYGFKSFQHTVLPQHSSSYWPMSKFGLTKKQILALRTPKMDLDHIFYLINTTFWQMCVLGLSDNLILFILGDIQNASLQFEAKKDLLARLGEQMCSFDKTTCSKACQLAQRPNKVLTSPLHPFCQLLCFACWLYDQILTEFRSLFPPVHCRFVYP